MATKKQGGGKRGRKIGRQGRNQTQVRYWSSRRLQKRKVRNIMKHTGLDQYAALKLWQQQRGGRRMRT